MEATTGTAALVVAIITATGLLLEKLTGRMRRVKGHCFGCCDIDVQNTSGRDLTPPKGSLEVEKVEKNVHFTENVDKFRFSETDDRIGLTPRNSLDKYKNDTKHPSKKIDCVERDCKGESQKHA
jgi:hypothetical protein